MSMILTEHLSFDQARCLVEGGGSDEHGKQKNLYMKGIFIQGGVKNHNQRVYPVNEIRNAVDSINDQIRQGFSICGEADHPETMNINIDRVSHMITEMHMDGPNGIGKLKILPTPCGNIVRTLLESGVKLGVSSRGQGNVDHNGSVQGFEIVTVDVVIRPSAPNAYPNAVYEMFNHNTRGSIREDLAKSMTNDITAQKYLKQEIVDFINSLKL